MRATPRDNHSDDLYSRHAANWDRLLLYYHIVLLRKILPTTNILDYVMDSFVKNVEFPHVYEKSFLKLYAYISGPNFMVWCGVSINVFLIYVLTTMQRYFIKLLS